MIARDAAFQRWEKGVRHPVIGEYLIRQRTFDSTLYKKTIWMKPPFMGKVVHYHMDNKALYADVALRQ